MLREVNMGKVVTLSRCRTDGVFFFSARAIAIRIVCPQNYAIRSVPQPAQTVGISNLSESCHGEYWC